MNADSNTVTVSGDQARVKASFDAVDGSFWEWHAPQGLSSIEIGVCISRDNQIINYQLLQYNSSTSRTVTFELKQEVLYVWINGTKPNKKSKVALKYDPSKEKIFPCAKIKGKGNSLTFIPFLTTPINNSTSNPFGGLSTKIPDKVPENEIAKKKAKIKQIYQLNEDRMMLLWDNNRLQVINRD